MAESEPSGADGAVEPERRIDYLRVSVTDRCNLRCVYCMPSTGVASMPHEEILSYEEIELFARASWLAGIRRIRITGGEPLVRKGAPDLVRMLASIDPELKLSLTTNGVLLERYAAELKAAGLRRVNVSLDSLDRDAYAGITRVGRLDDALAGIEKAVEVGLEPVKINVVVLKGLNDDTLAFGRLTLELPVHVRFIEYMPYFNEPGKWYVSSAETRARLAGLGTLEEVESPEGWGPADYSRLPGAAGTLGFISPVSCHFCDSCNRLRLTADGKMRTCLFDMNGRDVKGEIRSGAGIERLHEIIEGELARKHEEGDHNRIRAAGQVRAGDHMSRIGG